MHVTVVSLFSLALLLLVVALVREVRLRKSLQQLLRWILCRLKGGISEVHSIRSDHAGADREQWRL